MREKFENLINDEFEVNFKSGKSIEVLLNVNSGQIGAKVMPDIDTVKTEIAFYGNRKSKLAEEARAYLKDKVGFDVGMGIDYVVWESAILFLDWLESEVLEFFHGKDDENEVQELNAGLAVTDNLLVSNFMNELITIEKGAFVKLAHNPDGFDYDGSTESVDTAYFEILEDMSFSDLTSVLLKNVDEYIKDDTIPEGPASIGVPPIFTYHLGFIDDEDQKLIEDGMLNTNKVSSECIFFNYFGEDRMNENLLMYQPAASKLLIKEGTFLSSKQKEYIDGIGYTTKEEQLYKLDEDLDLQTIINIIFEKSDIDQYFKGQLEFKSGDEIPYLSLEIQKINTMVTSEKGKDIELINSEGLLSEQKEEFYEMKMLSTEGIEFQNIETGELILVDMGFLLNTVDYISTEKVFSFSFLEDFVILGAQDFFTEVEDGQSIRKDNTIDIKVSINSKGERILYDLEKNLCDYYDLNLDEVLRYLQTDFIGSVLNNFIKEEIPKMISGSYAEEIMKEGKFNFISDEE